MSQEERLHRKTPRNFVAYNVTNIRRTVILDVHCHNFDNFSKNYRATATNCLNICDLRKLRAKLRDDDHSRRKTMLQFLSI